MIFLSEIANTVADFGKGLMDYEEANSKKPNPGKTYEIAAEPKTKAQSPEDLELLNNLTQELTKTQNIVSGIMSQESELKATREENRRLKETIANFDLQVQDRLRKLQLEHEQEVGQIKNSFYIVHKLRETITNLEKQLTNQEALAFSKSSRIEALESQILSLQIKIDHQREHLCMLREDLTARTTQSHSWCLAERNKGMHTKTHEYKPKHTQSLTLRQELSQMKQGIMGIMFNREQRASRASGEQSSVMERKEVVRDYVHWGQPNVRQYEEETKKSTVSWYLVKNDGYEGDGVWSLSELGQRVFARGGGKYWGADPQEFANSHRSARGEIFENLVLKSMKMARSDVAFAEFHLSGPTYASLVQYELMDLSMKEIEELFTQKFEILKVNETIRAILDSYYIELLSHDKLDTCPWFGEFVYLWFERFEVDELTKKVIATTQDMKITKRKRAETI